MAYFRCTVGATGSGGAVITVTYDDTFYGQTITCSKDSTSYSKTATSSGTIDFAVPEEGTWRISATVSGNLYYTDVDVTSTFIGILEGVPNGSTATPVNDIQLWLKCAGIKDKSYTMLADVLEDYYTCERLFSDSNACDYMARSSSWAAIVTTDASVMEQIGKYDYCCKKLLGNATWAAAIVASDYKDYILGGDRKLIPIMTSYTAPSGTIVYNDNQNQYRTALNPYDSNNRNVWAPIAKSAGTGGDYIGYVFDSVVPNIGAVEIDCGDMTEATTYDLTIQSYDGSTWSDVDTWSVAVRKLAFDGANDVLLEDADSFIKSVNIANTRGVRVISKNKPLNLAGGYSIALAGFKIYACKTDLIHSAANDTVYYYDSNNVERQLCVTDANGNGTVDWSEMEPGIYTFYSTVAKNPDNLSEEYSRTVKITKTTTEVYLMPPNALYWYGFENDNIVGDETTANGWSSPNNLSTPTRNANYARLTAGSNIATGLAAKKFVQSSKVSGIVQGISGNDYGAIVAFSAKNTAASYFGVTGLTNSVIARVPTPLYSEEEVTYPAVHTYNGRTLDVYGFWKDDSRSITVHSAANDTVYYLGENNVHIPFAKTDATGTASVDLGLIPQGTYTLYSSVAKDPDNLSNYYSKTITIGPDTKSVKVMPDGAIYWYGWKDDTFYATNLAAMTVTVWNIPSTQSITFATNSFTTRATQNYSGGSSIAGFASTNLVDLSEYDSLKVVFASMNNPVASTEQSYLAVGQSTSVQRTKLIAVNNATNFVASIDVSDINTEQIMAVAMRATLNTPSTCEVNAIFYV